MLYVCIVCMYVYTYKEGLNHNQKNQIVTYNVNHERNMSNKLMIIMISE